MGTAAATQTQTQYLKLTSTGTFAAADAQTDIGAYFTLLCSTSGTCCYTSLCNGAKTIQKKSAMTIATLMLSILSAKLVF